MQSILVNNTAYIYMAVQIARPLLQEIEEIDSVISLLFKFDLDIWIM